MVVSDHTLPSQLINFNGVDPSGNYLFTPMGVEHLLDIVQQEFNETDESEQESVKSLSDAKNSDHENLIP